MVPVAKFPVQVADRHRNVVPERNKANANTFQKVNIFYNR
jgi:hypothetical protein